MHLINHSTVYAALALIHMAEKGDRVSAQELAETLSIPHPFLRRVLGTLQKQKIIASRRGQKGGFVLSRMPEEVSLLDIVTIFQGRPHLSGCSPEGSCKRQPVCPLSSEFTAIEEDLSRRLSDVTVRSLVENSNKYPDREKEKIC